MRRPIAIPFLITLALRSALPATAVGVGPSQGRAPRDPASVAPADGREPARPEPSPDRKGE